MIGNVARGIEFFANISFEYKTKLYKKFSSR